MKVIFLDIDGVLNSRSFFDTNLLWTRDNSDMLNEDQVQLLNALVEETDANIVISSSWRVGHSLVHLQYMLQGKGFKFPEKIIGATSSQTHLDRGSEISLWLKQVPVESFVILDDDCDMTGVMNNLIQTDLNVGLTQEHIDKAKEILQ